MSPADFHFLRPYAFALLLAIPLIIWLWRRIERCSGGWQRACDAHLLPYVTVHGRGARGALRLLLGIYLLATVALAGPAWRQLPLPLMQRQAALAIVLELSDSMRAADLKPDRLTRARYKIADLLAARRDGQFALVAYARDAYTVAPVTDDGATLLSLLEALDPSIMPGVGYDARRGIDRAMKLLAGAGIAQGDILLIADRADGSAGLAAEAARAKGYRVSVLGVGTVQGAPVALPQGGFLTDENGQMLLPKLDEKTLRAVAAAGKGAYATLTADRSDLAALGLLDASLRDTGYSATDSQVRHYQDEGPWLLLLLLPLAALLFRRGWLFGVALLMTGIAPRADAFDWKSLWERPDRRAWAALQRGDAKTAQELSEALAGRPDLQGAAAYRSADFAHAAEAFSGIDSAVGHYNRGNALAKAGRYDEAIAAYDEALARDPGFEDAKANKQAIEEWRKQQSPEPESESGGQDQKNGDQNRSDGKGDASSSSGRNESGDAQAGHDPPQNPSAPENLLERNAGQGDGSSGPPAADPENRQGHADKNDEDRSAPQDPAGDGQDNPKTQDQQQFSQAMQQALDQRKQGQGDKPAQSAAAGDPQTRREAEKRQAVEQWLRRVPDDPGGLLRNKFALEYQRRQREGEDDR